MIKPLFTKLYKSSNIYCIKYNCTKYIYGTGQILFKIGKYICSICGYTYDPAVGDPDHGIAPGTRFEDIPEDWKCPRCRQDKDKFSKA